MGRWLSPCETLPSLTQQTTGNRRSRIHCLRPESRATPDTATDQPRLRLEDRTPPPRVLCGAACPNADKHAPVAHRKAPLAAPNCVSTYWVSTLRIRLACSALLSLRRNAGHDPSLFHRPPVNRPRLPRMSR